MRTIGQYVTDDPRQLATQLGQLEQNVVTETTALEQSKTPRLVPVDDDPVSPRKTYTVGQCARLNTTPGAVTFNLSAPADKLPGEFIVVQASGAAGFTAVAVNCKINGATSYTPAAVAIVYRGYFDGAGYWF